MNKTLKKEYKLMKKEFVKDNRTIYGTSYSIDVAAQNRAELV